MTSFPIIRTLILALGLGLPLAAQADINSATERMMAIMKGAAAAQDQAAIATGAESANTTADLNRLPQSTIDFSVNQSSAMRDAALKAYVDALPPRDKAYGAQVLLGDPSQTGGGIGKLYFFVSRSMPNSLLKAYSLAALHTGGTLVMLGVRKGDTIKEYMEEVMADFNNADGQVLGGLELNPNLFDMFDIKVVPTVVWTTRQGLDDIGAGCEDLPEGVQVPQITLAGPDDEPLVVDKPVCAKATDASYYKISGALKLNYVLERFEEAGAPAEAMAFYATQLALQHANVNDRTQMVQSTGNSMTPIKGTIHLDALPRHVLLRWQEELATKHVQRGPYGPVFSEGGEDDVVYRKELTDKVEHGLGL